MDYYESAEGINISKERAKYEIEKHGLAGRNLQKIAASMAAMLLKLF